MRSRQRSALPAHHDETEVLLGTHAHALDPPHQAPPDIAYLSKLHARRNNHDGDINRGPHCRAGRDRTRTCGVHSRAVHELQQRQLECSGCWRHGVHGGGRQDRPPLNKASPMAPLPPPGRHPGCLVAQTLHADIAGNASQPAQTTQGHPRCGECSLNNAPAVALPCAWHAHGSGRLVAWVAIAVAGPAAGQRWCPDPPAEMVNSMGVSHAHPAPHVDVMQTLCLPTSCPPLQPMTSPKPRRAPPATPITPASPRSGPKTPKSPRAGVTSPSRSRKPAATAKTPATPKSPPRSAVASPTRRRTARKA